MQKLSRRQILKAISALPAVSPATSVLAQAANPQPQEWTGFAICDSCNHVPSCGIQFQAQGNNIISIQNWKENPRHWLCSKGMSTLQRLYNPNRLLYPMKRTAPKAQKIRAGFVLPGMRLTRPSLPTCSPPKEIRSRIRHVLCRRPERTETFYLSFGSLFRLSHLGHGILCRLPLRLHDG